MLGLIIILLATVAIAFAGYRLGTTQSDPNADNRDQQRNVALIVLALGCMFLLSGVLSTMAGNSLNPLNALTSPIPSIVI
jgi:uncharacterized membrane-anchored protein